MPGSAPPDYVVVGHIAKDVRPAYPTSRRSEIGPQVGPELDVGPGGYTLGGTVTYAGLTARRLGLTVGILTSAGPDLDVASALPGIEAVVVPAPATTTFENLYDAGHRRQYLRAVAAPILPEHVPAAWRDAPIVHFGPLAQEFGPEILDAFPGSRLRGLTPQGWLRRWDADGLVRRVEPPFLAGALARLDAVILSEEDVGGDWHTLQRYAAATQILVVTQGARGATLCKRGSCAAYPAFPAVEVDPTGAGDVFAAAFLIRLSQTGDPGEATIFANCAASFAVEGPGTSTLPSLGQVLARLATRK